VLFYRLIESADLDARGPGFHRWGIGIVDFRIGHSGEPLQFLALTISQGTRKEHAPRRPLFLRR